MRVLPSNTFGSDTYCCSDTSNTFGSDLRSLVVFGTAVLHHEARMCASSQVLATTEHDAAIIYADVDLAEERALICAERVPRMPCDGIYD